MSFDHDPESPFELDLRTAGTGTIVAVIVLPELDILLGAPEFGRNSPIAFPSSPPAADGWAQFGPVRARGFTIH